MTQELIARRLDGVIELDGRVDKPAWRTAEWSRRFVDMVDEAPAIYDTRAAVRWNDEHLYIAFTAEEPYLQAAQTERDSIVFLDNDLEVFIDGGDCYYELEVNAANTVYEVLFVWRDSLHTALDAIRSFGAEALVVALGVDTFEGDPISGFLLRSPDYLRIGQDIATSRLPTVFVFEGGYAVDEVGVNTVNVLEGFGS